MERSVQERLNLLYEIETIKATLVNFIDGGISLKVVVDLGGKDKFRNKRRFLDETRYQSSKYSNVSHLISVGYHYNTYISLDYPNKNYDSNDPNWGFKYKSIKIYGGSIGYITRKMDQFSNNMAEAYAFDKNNNLILYTDKIKRDIVYPSPQTSIEFSYDIYFNKYTNKKEMGVRLNLNNEYSVVVSAEITWSEIINKISSCNLTIMGMLMIQPYAASLSLRAISEVDNGEYNSYKRFGSCNDDPDDTMNRPDSVKINNTRPVTKKEKTKSFFDDI